MVAALKPGGWVVNEEFDSFSVPPDPTINSGEVLLKAQVAFSRLLAEHGVERRMGRLLFRRLRDHGLIAVGAEARMSILHSCRRRRRFVDTFIDSVPIGPSRDRRIRGSHASFLWTLQRRNDSFLWCVQRNPHMTDAKKSEVLQGTLDLMILKTLHALGPQHGFGIARRIEQVSRDVLQLNEGTVYTSLLRLLQQRWIVAEWGTSDNNRKAKFYSITARGEKQLAIETENWERISGVVGRVLRLEEER
jgi:PadR family transcriptional regulator PadR